MNPLHARISHEDCNKKEKVARRGKTKVATRYLRSRAPAPIDAAPGNRARMFRTGRTRSRRRSIPKPAARKWPSRKHAGVRNNQMAASGRTKPDAPDGFFLRFEIVRPAILDFPCIGGESCARKVSSQSRRARAGLTPRGFAEVRV